MKNIIGVRWRSIQKKYMNIYNINLSSNLFYIIDKVRLSGFRGLLMFCLLAKGSSIPLIGRNVRIMAPWNLKTGKRTYIGDNSYVECYCEDKVVLGDYVTLRENTWIQCRSGLNRPGQGLTIEDHVYIGPGSIIGVGGKITIKSGTQIGARLTMSAESHEYSEVHKNYTSGDVTRRGIVINNNCWIGNNVTILDGVEIGEGCVIGAGSVVTKSIASFTVIAGVPAKKIRSIN